MALGLPCLKLINQLESQPNLQAKQAGSQAAIGLKPTLSL
jgi:hypothetical protein